MKELNNREKKEIFESVWNQYEKKSFFEKFRIPIIVMVTLLFSLSSFIIFNQFKGLSSTNSSNIISKGEKNDIKTGNKSLITSIKSDKNIKIERNKTEIENKDLIISVKNNDKIDFEDDYSDDTIEDDYFAQDEDFEDSTDFEDETDSDNDKFVQDETNSEDNKFVQDETDSDLDNNEADDEDYFALTDEDYGLDDLDIDEIDEMLASL